MEDVNPTHLRPKNSTRQQSPDELGYMPLQGISATREGSISPVRPAPNVEYTPLDMKTRSWESRKKLRQSREDHWKGCFWSGCQGNGKEPSIKFWSNKCGH